MSLQRLSTGKNGERLAADYLRQQGYSILKHNFRTSAGEIDIIASIRDTLVFVEVKTRKSNFLDSPLEAVTKQKMVKISQAAQIYLSKRGLFDKPARFDVIAVEISAKGNSSIQHIENAFDLC